MRIRLVRVNISFLNTFEEFISSVPFYWSALYCFVLGAVMGFVVYRLVYRASIKQAKAQANFLLESAEELLENTKLEITEQQQELEHDLWSKVEKEHLQIEEKIETLDERSTALKQKRDNEYSQARQLTAQQEKKLDQFKLKVKEKESAYESVQKKFAHLKDQYCTVLEKLNNTDKKSAIEEVISSLLEERKKYSLNFITAAEEETKNHSELLAKNILNRVFNRFQREHCDERHIPSVYFEYPEQRKILVDEKRENLKIISEATGCDIIVADDMELVGVVGYDPVRRELARRILERLLKEKKPVTTDLCKKVCENIKKELMNSIRKDGENLAKELRLDYLSSEVRQVMGSLRYRYSYTQNQYFHCIEVGWICGLMASELGGLHHRLARRAGVLHDIGKAMDHELDGGHAVIGANFIKAQGEGAEVVHAVRAHHYDETPSTDLAYLVIAADAVSGSRPGARRSTVESYNQKVTEIENIAHSFEGVTDCQVLSGGRECRISVNSRKVSDIEAQKITEKVAARIENELSYPGQIKIVVIREVYYSDSTKKETAYQH